MGDLHQRLTELRRCLDDGLINQNGYDSARDEVINFWITNPTVPERSFWQKLYEKANDIFSARQLVYLTFLFNHLPACP
ncbi:unnamed protein product [Rhizophagus irregularis]|nr:unnamed protein product [Rhizophagus irregularis]